MAEYPRIEPETEIHRTAKALAHLAPSARLPLDSGSVEIRLHPDVSGAPATQQIVATLVNLLLRMKGIVRDLCVSGADGRELCSGVPLAGSTLNDGLHTLATSLKGPSSEYPTVFSTEGLAKPDLLVTVGLNDGDLVLGADAWRALFGSYAVQSRWDDRCPLGPILAATLGSAEIFKQLLRRAVGWSDGHLVDDLAFSLWNFGVDSAAEAGEDILSVRADDLAVAGAGAGGTAFLYSLMSFPIAHGQLTLVEPGSLKKSNLGRYLMSDYRQVHDAVHKLRSVEQFARQHAPALEIESIENEWHEVRRDWTRVIATVDTPEARRDIQRSKPMEILEAGVMLGTLYGVLRVVDGGWCLECKHPYDQNVTWRKRALRWGTSVKDVKQRYASQALVSRSDLEYLAKVQNRPLEQFLDLEGMPFDQVPALTECGETPLLQVPNQAAVLPFATTCAGVALAAEYIKSYMGVGSRLNNYFTHDLRFRPRSDRHVFKPRRPGCPACSNITR